MNNVNPPSRFTAHILLHTYTQERSQSSAESGFRISASQHFSTLRLTPPLVGISACQTLTVGEFEPGMWNRQALFPPLHTFVAGAPSPFPHGRSPSWPP